MGRPLLKKTRDAAEGGRSFLFVGLGVSLGMMENCEVAVVGRVGREDGGENCWFMDSFRVRRGESRGTMGA